MTTATPDRLLQTILALVPHPPSGRFTDTELLRRFVHNGDEDAFAALIARHGSMVLGACRRSLQDAESAEDVAQATFLVLARKASSVHRPEALAAWLHRTACQLALKHRRADTRRRCREAQLSRVSPRSMSDPIDELSNRELLEAIDEEIQRMPERFRLPVVLCCLEGRTLEETSKRLEWTLGSVKGRLERGRAELRDRLVRRGFALTAACLGLDVLREGARASLPAGFGAATLRAAVEFTSCSGAGIGSAVAAIAEEGVRSATVFTRKVVLSFLLVVGLLGGGVAAVGPPAHPKAEARARPAPPEKPQQRVDRQGDPLPDGALARLGTVRWRNLNEVDAMAFAPDGRSLAVASQVGVNLFDMKGKLTKRLRVADTASYRSLAFSPDGTRLACLCTLAEGGMLRTVGRIFEVGAERKPKAVDEKDLLWVGWSAAGKPLALLQKKDEVVMRELDTGKDRPFEASNKPHPRIPLFRSAYAPAAKLLAFPDSRGAIHVCDMASGKTLRTIEPNGGYVRTLALSSDGRSLASPITNNAGKTEVRIWDVATGEVRHAVAADQKFVVSETFAPDGKTLATAGCDEVRFWDASTGRDRARIRVPKSLGPNIAYSPDGKTLATANRHSATIQLWDVATGEPKVAPVSHTAPPDQIDFSPDGKRVASSAATADTLIVWNPASGEPVTVVRRGTWVQGTAFSADGKSLFSCWTDDQVIVSDASNGRQLHSLDLNDPARKGVRQSGLGMRLSWDRKTMVAFSLGFKRDGGEIEGSHLMTAWDAVSLERTFQRRSGRIDAGNTVSPDLQLLAVTQGGGDGPGDRLVRIEDCKTGEFRLNLPRLAGHTLAKAFSPDGRLLTTLDTAVILEGASQERTDTLKVWEVATAGEILSLPSMMNARIVFSADGRLLAVSAPSREIVLWDLRRAEELQRVKGFEADVNGLAFSPDNRRLVSGHSDSTLLVWEVKKPAKVKPLDAEGITKAWADLASDPRKAFAARGSLADSPAEAVALLKKRVGPIRPADADQLASLLADLDDDSFAAREKAQKGLVSLGERATEALREALGKKPSAEARKRIQALLRLADNPIPDRETLRAVRAIGALEDIGTREAKAILETLAGGASGARRTQEAKAALRRMGHASATKP